MGRVIAIDYGKKRIGLAVSDPSKIIAGGLTTVGPSEIFKFLEDYTAKESVERFVVGLPKTMAGENSDSMKYIEPFVRGLKNKFPNIPVEFFDERFTSVLANRAIIESGKGKKDRRENKGLVDMVSATIILEGWMESIRFNA